MYAVVKTGGKQYRVAPDDLITVERLDGEVGDIITLDDVLMIAGDGNVEVGEPLIDGASVAAELVKQGRGKKIIIFKKKRRKHYRRKNGHRQDLTILKVTEILTGGKKPSKKAAKPAAKTDEKAPAAKTAAPAAKTATPAAKTAAPGKLSDEDIAKKIAAATAGGALFTAPSGKADDLKKISGVGPVLEKKLNELGVTKFAQVAAFTADDILMVGEVLSFKGRIERDEWLPQAAALAAGEDKS